MNLSVAVLLALKIISSGFIIRDLVDNGFWPSKNVRTSYYCFKSKVPAKIKNPNTAPKTQIEKIVFHLFRYPFPLFVNSEIDV